MTRMSVVLSWSTYPDLKSCQRNLVNWVASMKKGVTLKQTETNDFALVSSQTNFRVAVETSWKAGRIYFWQQLVCLASPISPFHGFSQPAVETDLTFRGPEHFRSCVCQGISEDRWLHNSLKWSQMCFHFYPPVHTNAFICMYLCKVYQTWTCFRLRRLTWHTVVGASTIHS